ncbi:MAG: NADH-quinone oxidoreductase subunit J [Chloroflexi bacterium]|nr:NADH-quinone oxidoreductase subunit J [Chloroflexota bacterium]
MPGEGTENTLIVDIVFWVIAISTIVAAVAVVQLRDLFRAALFLIVSFVGVAGLFILMRAEFLAAVQILIYVGAISVLILFAIMMTRDVEEGSPSHSLRIPVGVLAALFAAAAIFVAVSTNWNTIDEAAFSPASEDAIAEVFSNTVPWIARLLLQDFVLTLEIAGVVLLAAMIGALALIRER